MNPLLRLGIRQKMVLILAATLVLSLSLSGWFALKFEREELLRETQRHGAEVAHFVSSALAYSVVGYDYHTIELLLKELIGQGDLLYARVISPRGNTMAEVGRPVEGALAINHDISLNDEVVGKLVLGLSTERILRTVEKRKLLLIRQEAVVILFIILVEFIALSFIIVRPISALSRAIRQGIGADHPEPIRIDSNDECGDVARQFNRLHSRLLEANAQLQSKVDFTNQELKQAHECLLAQSEELRRVNAELARAAVTDALTGLYNRRYFDQLMDSELALSIRTQEPSSVILFDIDHFKTCNDQHGHAVGDAVLKHVADVLMKHVRKSDVVSRIGGDEFAVLCRRSPPEAALHVARALCDHVTKRAVMAGQVALRVTLSGGVAGMMSASPVATVGQWLERADRALYESKAQGRNRVTLFTACPAGVREIERA